MSSTISSQSPALTAQNAADALLRNDRTANAPEILAPNPPNKLDASYELSLSESAQATMGSARPSVNTPTDAQKQLDLIKATAQQSANNVLNLQKPNAKSVIDLLA